MRPPCTTLYRASSTAQLPISKVLDLKPLSYIFSREARHVCLGQSPVAGHACRTLRKNIRIVNSSAALHPVNPRSAPACRQKICKANPVTQGGLCPLLVQVCTSERDNVQGFRELEKRTEDGRSIPRILAGSETSRPLSIRDSRRTAAIRAKSTVFSSFRSGNSCLGGSRSMLQASCGDALFCRTTRCV